MSNNHNFPTVKTYSTKWQRSYRLYREKDKLFDAAQNSTKNSQKEEMTQQDKERNRQSKPSVSSRCRFPSKDSSTAQSIQKSPKRVSRPMTVTSMPNEPSSSARAIAASPIQRPATVAHARIPTGNPMITKPLRRYGVPTFSRNDVKRQKSSTATSSLEILHSPPKSLRVETLLKYRPEHAEKAYSKNDSYIHEWLRGVEEARAESRARRAQYKKDTDSSIELPREAQTEHPALARKNSANELLKDMMKAFKSSSMEKSSELSNIREQPSLPEKPASETPVKHVISAKLTKQEEKNKPIQTKKSRIPCLSASYKSSRTTSCSDSVKQFSTPTVTRNTVSSNTYTYKWTATSSQDATASHQMSKTSNTLKESPMICLKGLKYKKLNSTTRPKALSLGNVEFSQCLSPIINEAEERRKSAESTPEISRKRTSSERENVVPRKQKRGGLKEGMLEPKASTVLFTPQSNKNMLTPDFSSIRFDKSTGKRTEALKLTADAVRKPFNLETTEKETHDDKKSPLVNKKMPVPRPVITSTPDSQHKYIKPELLLLEDLSSVAPPSAFEDELQPLRTSDYEVNSEEIVCASDLYLEVDIPQVQAVETPRELRKDKKEDETNKESPLDNTYTITPVTSSGNRKKSKQQESLQSSSKDKQKKSTKLTKAPVMCIAANSYPRSTKSQDSLGSSKKRWQYFSRPSQSFRLPAQSKEKKKGSKKITIIPQCALVAVQRVRPKTRKPFVQMTIAPQTDELMTEIKKAPPDDIMTTSRRFSLQAES